MFLKKNQNTPRPSEHPPGMGEKLSKRLLGCGTFFIIEDNTLLALNVSSIPANGIFLTEKLQNENKNAQRVEND